MHILIIFHHFTTDGFHPWNYLIPGMHQWHIKCLSTCLNLSRDNFSSNSISPTARCHIIWAQEVLSLMLYTMHHTSNSPVTKFLPNLCAETNGACSHPIWLSFPPGSPQQWLLPAIYSIKSKQVNCLSPPTGAQYLSEAAGLMKQFLQRRLMSTLSLSHLRLDFHFVDTDRIL